MSLQNNCMILIYIYILDNYNNYVITKQGQWTEGNIYRERPFNFMDVKKDTPPKKKI